MLTDRILFEDAEAILIDKPAGLPVDAPRDGGGSVEMALDALRLGFRRPPSIVHRLDRDTSGCLLLARTERAHRRFAAAFAAGLVAKRYLAVLDGVPVGESGTIDLPLAKRSSREAGWRMVADPKGKAAVTRWSLLGVAGGRACMLFEPATGRTHQLRVHAASGLGVPIAGDPVYGRGRGEGMRLHALALTMPREGKPAIEARAPVPATFAAFAGLVPE